jgi:hypothetical protein
MAMPPGGSPAPVEHPKVTFSYGAMEARRLPATGTQTSATTRPRPQATPSQPSRPPARASVGHALAREEIVDAASALGREPAELQDFVEHQHARLVERYGDTAPSLDALVNAVTQAARHSKQARIPGDAFRLSVKVEHGTPFLVADPVDPARSKARYFPVDTAASMVVANPPHRPEGMIAKDLGIHPDTLAHQVEAGHYALKRVFGDRAPTLEDTYAAVDRLVQKHPLDASAGRLIIDNVEGKPLARLIPGLGSFFTPVFEEITPGESRR